MVDIGFTKSGDTKVRTSNYPTEEAKKEFCENIAKHFNTSVVTSKQISEFCKLNNLPYPYFLTYDKSRSAGWGKYKVQEGAVDTAVKHSVHQITPPDPVMPPSVSLDDYEDAFVPVKDPTYVPFGFYNDLKNIIDSKVFYPVYVTGLSGNGKTLMVLQICAALGRELIRVNITALTDELDLFGTYELVDGKTIRKEGPVLTAMKRGAILLLDETDYGSEKLLCLQPVLEGKPFLDKKTNTVIHPQPGFNVIACANTKGKGSVDGRFIGANVLNDAFLERFAITVEQEYPNPTTERKILDRNFEVLGLQEPAFSGCLIDWAEQIRKAFKDGAVDEIISTRRLVHIVKAFAIFGEREKAIRLCLNRFDDDTKVAFLDFYTKIDAAAKQKATTPPPAPQPNKTTDGGSVPASSDTKFVVLATKIGKAFGTNVVIRAEHPVGGGIDEIAVYAKGNRNAESSDALPDITLDPIGFERRIRKMVEAAVTGVTF